MGEFLFYHKGGLSWVVKLDHTKHLLRLCWDAENLSDFSSTSPERLQYHCFPLTKLHLILVAQSTKLKKNVSKATAHYSFSSAIHLNLQFSGTSLLSEIWLFGKPKSSEIFLLDTSNRSKCKCKEYKFDSFKDIESMLPSFRQGITHFWQVKWALF